MEFRILGPLEARHDGRTIPLGGIRQRSLLSALLLHPNRSVSLRSLEELIWDAPPPSAEANLRKFVWQLRKALHEPGDGDARIVRENGFRIRVRPGELDLWTFDELSGKGRDALRGGDPAAAAELFRRALALTTTTPLEGIHLGPRLDELRAELAERRDRVLEGLFEARLASGEHLDVIGELRGFLARQPFREPVAGLLMLALFRGGRQDQALGVFRQTRERLVDELGVEPGAELRDLHQRILRADPGLDAYGPPPPEPATPPPAPAAPVPAPPRPAQLPMAVPAFSGRRQALAELTALSFRTPVVAITGTAGVGKSALAIRWARGVRGRFPDGQLYVNLRGFDPEKSAMDPAEALCGFLGALGVSAACVPTGLEAQSALFRSLLADRRVLVVLDNAADAEQVRPLLPGADGCFTLVTSRNQPYGLLAAGTASALSLDVLSPGEAADLLAARLGSGRVGAEPGAVDRIVERCARLPMALAIVAARAAAQPSFALGVLADELDASAGVLDAFDSCCDPGTDLRSTFSWSFQELGADAARLFRLLGLHAGPDVGVNAAASLAGVSPERTRRLLHELDQARMLNERVPGRYAFHDLLRAYACELAYCSTRAEEREEGRLRLLDHYAHSVDAAVARMDPLRRATPPLPAAEGFVREEFASPSAASAWLSAECDVLVNAVESAYATGGDGHAWRIADGLGVYLRRKGMGGTWLQVSRTGLRAAERAADPAGLAASRYQLAVAEYQHGDRAASREHLREAQNAYRRLGDDYGQANVLFVECWALEAAGDFRGALDCSTRMLALYRRAGHLGGEGRALNTVGWYLAMLGRPDEALAYCRLALAILRGQGDPAGLAATLDSIGYVHMGLGEYRDAVRRFAESVEQYRGLADHYFMTDPLRNLGDAHHALGDRAKARAAWAEALLIHLQTGRPGAERVRARLAGA